eukprot:5385544-Lingulodinium_polyedra.AAC.1
MVVSHFFEDCSVKPWSAVNPHPAQYVVDVYTRPRCFCLCVPAGETKGDVTTRFRLMPRH